jgi:two-component system, response regulator YesN
MYRLLIVDDEELIVNGLYEVFRCMEGLDLDIYKAYSGQEALNWLNRTRMDIVITDIQMPEINGIRLMEEIEKNWTQCRVIFLSGYSEFEYAYRAIQSPGVSYLLKTESYERIVEVVQNAIADIERDNQNEALIQDAKKCIDEATELYQRDYLLYLLSGEMSAKVSQQQFRALNLPLKAEAPVILVLGAVSNLPKQADYSLWVQSIYAVLQTIRRYLAGHVYNIVMLDQRHHPVILVQPLETDTPYAKTVAFLEGTLEAVQNACQTGLQLSISFSIGGEMTHWSDLSAKYYQLVQMLGYRIGSESEALLIDRERDNPLRNEKSAIPGEDVTGCLNNWLNQRAATFLEQHMESGQRDAYFTLLHGILTPLSCVTSMHNPLALEAYYSVALGLLSFINRKHLTDKVAFRIGQYQLMRADQFPDWQAAADYLTELSGILFELYLNEQKTRADQTIACLQRFIHDHIGEDLSLLRLSEQVYLNPSYLSRIYKQETGIKLSVFIESVRIAKAKELLQDERQKIAAIAQAIGYDSPTSFTRFFKNACGITPQAYRDQCALKHNSKK